jgi:hypothetical protein
MYQFNNYLLSLISYLEEVQKESDPVIGFADELLDEALEGEVQIGFQLC